MKLFQKEIFTQTEKLVSSFHTQCIMVIYSSKSLTEKDKNYVNKVYNKAM